MKWATTPAASRTDLTYEIAYNHDFIPARSPKASVRLSSEGGKTTPLLFNFNTGLYYEIDDGSKTVWDLVDGKRTVKEIERLAKAEKNLDGSEEVIPSLIFFAEAGMLESIEEKVKRKRVNVRSAYITEVTLFWDASRFFRAIHGIIRPVLRSFMVWMSMAIVLIAVIIYATHFLSIFGDAHNFQILGSSVVGFLFYNYVILGPVIVVHEISHGVALVHYTGKAGEVGTGLFYFGPMFFVDIATYWTLPRPQRIMIMWAGNLSTLLIGSTIVLVGVLFPYPPAVARLLDLAAFWCFYLTLWNLAPPFETDGYHILSDLVGQPNLRSDAFSLVKSSLLRRFGRTENKEEPPKPANTRFLLPYAFFAIGFLAFIAFQTLRFTFYMASDTALWTARMALSLLPGQAIAPLAYAVGATTISYFALTIGGYGILVENQFKKLFARGLKFEALHDRDLSVFFCVPGPLSSKSASRIDEKIRSGASGLASNYSVGHQGPLFYTNIRMGGTMMAFPQIKASLQKVERRFFQVHQEIIAGTVPNANTTLLSFQGDFPTLPKLLSNMASNMHPSDRAQVKSALKEFLTRQTQTVRNLTISTFATVWTVEVPPAGLFDLLTTILPSLLVEDLVLTDLPGDAEEFKKQVVYGLDTIADLAAKSSEEQAKALAHPEKHQLVASFEPVKGRIMLVGRTEWMEGHLTEMGSLLSIQAWTGFVDNLLADTCLNLRSIIQSFPELSEFKDLKGGEIIALSNYVSCLGQIGESLRRSLDDSHHTIRQANSTLRELKALFHSGLGGGKPLDSILGVNIENLQSVPSGLRETEVLSKEAFAWAEAMKEPLAAERGERERQYVAKRRNVVRSYLSVGPLSLVLGAVGLFQPPPMAFALLGGAAAAQGIYFLWYYRTLVFSRKVPRYTSPDFILVLDSLYALARTLGALVIGLNTLSLAEVLEKQGHDERKGEVKPLETPA